MYIRGRIDKSLIDCIFADECADRDKKVRNKSVAVLDIRSSEVTAAVGERGVNNTFIIKSKYSCAYDGYADGELLDIDSFNSAVRSVVSDTVAASGERVDRFFIGVPDEFVKTRVAEGVLAFASPARIRKGDIATVRRQSRPRDEGGYSVIDVSPVCYILSDKRRVIDPEGCVTDSLRAKMSWFLGRDAFEECVRNAFRPFPAITSLRLIPSALAQANYLIEPHVRDGCAALLDMGYISSTYSIACGNGLVFSQPFSVGTGHIALLLAEELKIPFEVASQFLPLVNLNAKEKLTSRQEIKYDGKVYSFSTSDLRDVIREGLDGVCEMVEECMQTYSERDMTGKPLYVTGEGIKAIRGTAEHLSNRLVCAVEVIAPRVPYYDKPKFSSLFSLLNAALGER